MKLLGFNFLSGRKAIIAFLAAGLFLTGAFVLYAHFSESARAQTPVIIPPSDVRVEPLSSCAFDVSWDRVEGGSIQYNVTRGNFTVENLGDDRLDENRVFFIDRSIDSPFGGNIDPRTSFSYSVQTVDILWGTESAWSLPTTGISNPLPAEPSRPRNIEVEAKRVEGRIELKWMLENQVPAAYGSFQVFRAVSTDGGRNYSDPTMIASVPASQILGEKYFYNDNNNIDFSNSYRYSIRTKQTGGQGCNPNRPEHYVLSQYSEAVVIPAIPSDLSAEFFHDPRKIVLEWSDNSHGDGNETHFHIQRSIGSAFRENETISVLKNQDTTSHEETTVSVPGIPSSGVHTYWYRIRSCIDDRCSPFTESVSATTGLPAPTNLVASVVVLDEPNAVINVSWRWPLNVFYPNQRYEIEWRERGEGSSSRFIDHEGDPSDAQTEFFEVAAGKIYDFRIRTRVDQDNSDWTSFVSVNTDVLPVRGWAWANVGETDGTHHGIGWIRMSWDSPDGNGNKDDSGNKYGVFFDSEGKLSGYAWAGSSEGFGWLSFNEGDIKDCPISGTCEAKIDFENEKFVGWARFISNYEGGGSWNGWVSLSSKSGEPDYGWKFEVGSEDGEDSVNSGERKEVKVTGHAWGGHVTGWVLADFNIEIPLVEWPTLYDVIPFTEGNDVKAAVVWENFKDYGRMQIMVKEYQEGDEDLSEEDIRNFSREWEFEIRAGTMEDISGKGCHGRFPANIEIPAQVQTRVQGRLDNLPMHCTENQTEVILKDLEQGRKYHVFVRGWLVEEEKD